jgi:nucleoside-diphosphate-sugar epimerase
MANVLIIGGSGCVGQETTKWLLEQNTEKIVCLSRGKTEFAAMDNVTYEIGDILDTNSISQVLEKHQISHVLHTAALRTSDCKENPSLAVKININGTTNVLEALRLYGKIKRLVFISTAAVYKVPADDSFADEKTPTYPLNAYTATKIACENMIECYSQNYDIPATIIRPQIIYGPSRGTDGSTAGVSTAIKSAANDQKYTIPFSGQIGFHFSGDIGKYHGKALLESPNHFDTYNLPGLSLKVEDIANAVNKKCGQELIDYKENTYSFPKGIIHQKFLEDFSDCKPTTLEQALTQMLKK